MADVKSQDELELEKFNRTMNVVAKKVSYFRANPHRFISEVLGIENLRWFQKIIIWAMMKYDFFMYIAARGQGNSLALYKSRKIGKF